MGMAACSTTSNPRKEPNQMKREIRLAPRPQRFELRKNQDGTRTLSGYAVIFNSLSSDLGGFREKISPGTFTQSLIDHPDVLILNQHDAGQPLARVSAGAVVRQDNKGVYFSCKLPDTTSARDLAALMDSGIVSQMSFGFSVPDGGDDWQLVDGMVIRTVNVAALYEISLVTEPAYESSYANLRSCPSALRSKLTQRDQSHVDYVSDPESEGYNPDDPDFDPDWAPDDSDQEEEQDSKRNDNLRVSMLFAHRFLTF
jgi:HK97 family phage prohead protease